jgi:hypothetical protein
VERCRKNTVDHVIVYRAETSEKPEDDRIKHNVNNQGGVGLRGQFTLPDASADDRVEYLAPLDEESLMEFCNSLALLRFGKQCDICVAEPAALQDRGELLHQRPSILNVDSVSGTLSSALIIRRITSIATACFDSPSGRQCS